MKISNVSNTFNKKSNFKPSFEKIKIDTDFIRHVGMEEFLPDIMKKISVLESKHPDKDCCFLIHNHDIAFPKLEIFHSQKRPNGKPNTPLPVLGNLFLNNDVYQYSLMLEKTKYKEFFDFKNEPEKAQKTLFYYINFGFEYINKCKQKEIEFLSDPKVAKLPKWKFSTKVKGDALLEMAKDVQNNLI